MKISVLGVGKVGRNLVKTLVNDNHDVVAIDKSRARISKLVNEFDINGIVGGGVEKETMLQADVGLSDVFIACTSRDEVNVLSSILAKKLGAKATIARVRDPELFDEINGMKEEFGVDLAFNPELRTAHAISQVLKFPSANKVESFAGGRAIMVPFTIEKGNTIIGKSLIEIANYGYKLLFAMVVRGEDTFIPRGDFVIEEDDEVYIIAKEAELVNFCKKIKIFKPRAKSVFIVGGGRISYYLAKDLIDGGVSVKIMEKDEDKCEKLSVDLDKATILCGDGTDMNALDEENFKNTDALVALTDMDETNVIISLYAKEKKIDKVVTKINRNHVLEMVKTIGLDTIISPKEVIANHVIKFVRATELGKDEKINSLYRIHDKIEAIEFDVVDDGIFSDKTLKELKIRKDVLIGGIVRQGEYILPSGDCQISVGDKVIVLAKANAVSELADVLK